MSRPLYKQPSESRMFSVNFAANLESGETINQIDSVTVTGTGLTVGSQSITADGKQVQFRVSDGTAGESYQITVVARTTQSNILEGDGILVVKQL